ncbi:MAG TPA: hypothetical protein VFQ54_00430, partial [Thermomicrobiales bacterium]|nr:hypothetical protein [Thermomicrobiales bacterium]
MVAQSRISIGYLGISILAVASYFAMSGTPQLLTYDGIGIFAVAGVIVGIWMYRPAAALIWNTIAFGLLLMITGDLIGNIADITGETLPFPSVSDGFYLVGNLAIVLACAMVIRRRNTFRDIGGFIDATILATSATLLIWTVMIQPYTDDPSLSIPQRFVSLAYPAMDVIMAGVGVRLLLTGGRQSPSFYLITAALGATLVGDITYAELTLRDAYHSGDAIDLAFLLWYLLWGAAALHPSMTMVTDGVDDPILRTSGLRMTGLVGAVLVVPITAIYHWWRNEPFEIPVFVTG